jgi:ribonuclease T2
MPPARLRCRLALILAFGPGAALAEEAAFDHYLLALTWMPSFCALEGEARGDRRCVAGQNYDWLVHGLWPQGPGGTWPEYCATDHRNPSRRDTAAQIDLFGAAGPAWHQWRKHGSCTGLDPTDYYTATRDAVGRLTLPADISAEVPIAPAAVEAALIAANPALDASMMITTCRQGLIVELRVCMTLDLQPRPCDPELFVRECKSEAARLPAAGQSALD